MPTYYLDGYNVIYRCPELQILAEEDFEAARDTLVDRVARFAAVTGAAIKIVFDGRGRRAEPGEARGAPGLEIMYSPGHQSADALIERLVYNSRQRREIIVVSGDAGIRQLCTALGSFVMAPEHFLTMVRDKLRESGVALRREHERYRRMTVEDRLENGARDRLNELKGKLCPGKDPGRANGTGS
jgi:hypothetical protein